MNIIGLKDEYEYNEDIILDTTGGNGNGIVEYTFTNQNTNVITKLTNGENTYNGLDAAGYTVQAEKLGDQNYNSTISPEVSFTVLTIEQAAINITNVNNSYPYLAPIHFSVVGGSSTGHAIFTLYEEESEENYTMVSNDIVSPLENLLVGSYRLECTKLGDVNYKDISTFVEFSVTKIDQPTPLIIRSETGGTFFRYSQSSLTAIVSGGNGDGAITFSSTPPVEMSGNTVSLFTDVGIYYITATKAGDRNYNSTQSNTLLFKIAKVRQDPLVLENNAESYVYDPELSIDFNNYVTGGSGTGAISVYSNGVLLEENTLDKPNAGTYNIKVIKFGDRNYVNIGIAGTIYVTKAPQQDIEFEMENQYTYGDEIILYAYSPTVTNGNLTFSYNGATLDNLTGFDVGTYTIVALNTGGINYFDISGEKTIEIIKAEQSDDFEITTDNGFTYNPSLRIVFNATGGSGNGPITYELESDFNQDGNTTVIEGLKYIDGAEVGDYTLTATRDGGKNYHNNTVSAIF